MKEFASSLVDEVRPREDGHFLYPASKSVEKKNGAGRVVDNAQCGDVYRLRLGRIRMDNDGISMTACSSMRSAVVIKRIVQDRVLRWHHHGGVRPPMPRHHATNDHNIALLRHGKLPVRLSSSAHHHERFQEGRSGAVAKFS
jgi:hypothetical protein